MSRLFHGLFLLSVLLLTSANLLSEWLLQLCPLPDEYGQCASLVETQRQTAQMACLAQTSVERLCYKEKVADALESGEISLLEAAACFRALHEDPGSWHHPSRPRPANNDGEGWCREVIRWTETRMRFVQSSYQADALRNRLETELEDQLEHHGGVTLPG